MKTRLFSLLLAVWTCLSAVSSQAQTNPLVDTIWEGRVRISSLSPLLYESGVANPDLQAVNVSTFLPVEVWFVDGSKFLVVVRREKIEPLVGEPSPYTYELVAGLHPDDKDFPGGGGRYVTSATYARKGSSYTFLATQECVQTGTSWSIGSKTTITGKFSLRGNVLNLQSATLVYAPNPLGPSDFKLNPPLPRFSGTLNKTVRKPSTEFPGWSRGS